MKQEFEITIDLTTNTIPVEKLKVAERAIRNRILNSTAKTNAITWQKREVLIILVEELERL